MAGRAIFGRRFPIRPKLLRGLSGPADQTLQTFTQQFFINNLPDATLSLGEVILPAGVGTGFALSANAATLSIESNLSAGTNEIALSNPEVTLITDQFIDAGTPTILLHTAGAILIVAGAGQSPRAMRYRWGRILHWVYKKP